MSGGNNVRRIFPTNLKYARPNHLARLALHQRALFTYSSPMFGMGLGELVVILVIVMIIFGAGRLPEIGEGLGRGIRNFRKAVKTPDEIDITPKPDEQKGPGEGKTQSS